MDWSWFYASIVPTALLVLTLGIYALQWHAMVRASRLEALLAILRYFEDSERKRAREFMYAHGEELRRFFTREFTVDDHDEIDAEVLSISGGTMGIRDIDIGLNALNNACYLIRKRYAPGEVVDDFLRNTLVRVWEAYGGYITWRRTRNDVNWPSKYAEHLEWIVKRIKRDRYG